MCPIGFNAYQAFDKNMRANPLCLIAKRLCEGIVEGTGVALSRPCFLGPFFSVF